MSHDEFLRGVSKNLFPRNKLTFNQPRANLVRSKRYVGFSFRYLLHVGGAGVLLCVHALIFSLPRPRVAIFSPSKSSVRCL